MGIDYLAIPHILLFLQNFWFLIHSFFHLQAVSVTQTAPVEVCFLQSIKNKKCFYYTYFSVPQLMLRLVISSSFQTYPLRRELVLTTNSDVPTTEHIIYLDKVIIKPYRFDDTIVIHKRKSFVNINFASRFSKLFS